MYREVEPGAALRGDVRCVWTYEGEADGTPQRIAPDGCCELIVHVGNPYTEHPGGLAQPAILFAGQLTRPLALVATGPVAVLGVRFAPDGAWGFLRRDLDVATDLRVDLSGTFGELLARVRAARDWAARIDLVEACVAARAAAPDGVVRSAVAALMQGEALAIGRLSERQFQRRFKARVGVAPRTLTAIVRFRRVFEAIEYPQTHDWLGAALAAGYFDQPQMARDFRRFLGCTATEWARQKAGLATALASETYKPSVCGAAKLGSGG